MKKWLIKKKILVGSYVLALGVNLLPSISFPDFNMDLWWIDAGLFFSIVIVALMGWHIVNSEGLWSEWLATLGALASLFNGFAYTHIQLRAIATPLYIGFVTPLFGFNKFLEWRYGKFSNLMAIGYVLLLMIRLIVRRKREKQAVESDSC
ncbi:MAG: hypothetical protein JW702_02025 [Clostridiales bacterium]|nr:hypothetical protein [Clostridiales bacterium]